MQYEMHSSNWYEELIVCHVCMDNYYCFFCMLSFFLTGLVVRICILDGFSRRVTDTDSGSGLRENLTTG